VGAHALVGKSNGLRWKGGTPLEGIGCKEAMFRANLAGRVRCTPPTSGSQTCGKGEWDVRQARLLRVTAEGVPWGSTR
jgi:hypothetical protein